MCMDEWVYELVNEWIISVWLYPHLDFHWCIFKVALLDFGYQLCQILRMFSHIIKVTVFFFPRSKQLRGHLYSI